VVSFLFSRERLRPSNPTQNPEVFFRSVLPSSPNGYLRTEEGCWATRGLELENREVVAQQTTRGERSHPVSIEREKTGQVAFQFALFVLSLVHPAEAYLER
jgi:hypothetical protein